MNGIPLAAITHPMLTLALCIIGIFVFVFGGTALVLYSHWSSWKRGPHPGEGACMACGSTDLDVLAPGVYRCRACGHEGGKNLAAMEADEARGEWEKRPWPERIAAARADLVDGKRQLEAIESDMETVAKGDTPRLLGNSELDPNSALLILFGKIREAATKVSDAALKVPGIRSPIIGDVNWETVHGAQLVPAYANTRAAVTAALGALEAMAAAEQPTAGASAATDAGTNPDPE